MEYTAIADSSSGYYAALREHSRKYDGLFFVCVRSTGIYCRPICPAKAVAEQNCVFFVTAAACEYAGYRPCLRCRPELAPLPPIDGSASAALRTARYIDDTLLPDDTLREVATTLGRPVSELENTFVQEFGFTARQYALTRRLLMAKQLLHDTNLDLTTIAAASMFDSPASLAAAMQRTYRFGPERLQRRPIAAQDDDAFVLVLGYSRMQHKPNRAVQVPYRHSAIHVLHNAAVCQLYLHIPNKLSRHVADIARQVRTCTN